MKRGAWVALFLFSASAPAFAQQGVVDGLNDQQRLGRQVFAQSCGVCHLRPAFNVRTYGPMLSKASSGGDDARMRTTITEGTPRMPAFKFYLQSHEIDAIIAYIRTIAPRAPAPAPAPAAAPPPVD